MELHIQLFFRYAVTLVTGQACAYNTHWKKIDNYGILRSRTVRIGTLRMDLGPESIIPSHAFSPLSEKINFRKLKLRTNAYFYVKMRIFADNYR